MADIDLPPPVLGDDDLPDDELELPPPVDDELELADDELPPPVDDEPAEPADDELTPQDVPPPPSVGGHCICKRKRCNLMFPAELIENMRKEQKHKETLNKNKQ